MYILYINPLEVLTVTIKLNFRIEFNILLVLVEESVSRATLQFVAKPTHKDNEPQRFLKNRNRFVTKKKKPPSRFT